MSKVVAIIGMHRSGTSLLARYLHKGGVAMGERLLGTTWSNPAGHYEDVAILGWHNQVLAAHGLDHRVVSQMKWEIDAGMQSQAEALVMERNKKYPRWGWKDPRTCLFLPFWKALVPGCLFVIVYREPIAVVRSLLWRDIFNYYEETNRIQRWRQNQFDQKTIDERAETYLRMWIWYNREIERHLLNDVSVLRVCLSFNEVCNARFDVLTDYVDHLNDEQPFDIGMSEVKQKGHIKFRLSETLKEEAELLYQHFDTQCKELKSRTTS